jgi:hypothetical protein
LTASHLVDLACFSHSQWVRLPQLECWITTTPALYCSLCVKTEEMSAQQLCVTRLDSWFAWRWLCVASTVVFDASAINVRVPRPRPRPISLLFAMTVGQAVTLLWVHACRWEEEYETTYCDTMLLF